MIGQAVIIVRIRLRGILLLFLCMLLSVCHVSAEGIHMEEERLVIHDDADIFDNNEVMVRFLHGVSKSDDIGVGVLTTRDNTYTASQHAELFQKKYLSGDSVVFVIDMNSRKIWLRAQGEVKETITDQLAYSITDDIYKLATEGKYTSCVIGAFTSVDDALNGKVVAEPMRYICCALVAVILGFTLTYIAVVLSRIRLKKYSVDWYLESTPYEYNFDKSVTLVSVSRVHHTSSSGSSDSDSGGGSFDGGGGGHSF